ncbi:Sensory transduction protein regX3 [bioreactor metagenome]|uniref:Sensory transduction protein regX3 n=1 Tax=bioreactor metagenome TaxID=1076179 RepID=A0A645BI41_9ZZZZ
MTAKKSILVVDDEPKILDVITSFLASKGYTVHTAENGQKALEIFEKNNISLLVLDLMLPDVSGEEVCARIRKTSRVPIIMLTAKSQEPDLLNGLQIGADDYVTKPFSLKELHARIETVLRRASGDLVPLTVKSSWRHGDLIIDFEKNLVTKKGNRINLTQSEHKILSALIKYPGKVFTREELIDLVFGNDFDGYDRVIDTHIKNLRRKIEDNPQLPVYILTIHGLGYKFGGE